jgi:hypothetical protein
VLNILAAAGWNGVVILVVLLLHRPLKMLAMRMVFQVFGMPQKDQIKWAKKESSRNSTLDMARGFWNRRSQGRPNVDVAPVKRLQRSRTGNGHEREGDDAA